MKNKKKSICIISAFYNEEQNLKRFIKKFNRVKLKLIKMGYTINLIMVNDGSTDKSIEIIKKILKLKKNIKIVDLKKNYGQQIAIYSGLKEGKSQLFGVLDSDCQQDPNYFIKMINLLETKKLDLVQMKKRYGNYENPIKRFLSKFFYSVFSNITNVDIDSGSSDFYLFTNKIRKKIISSKISMFFLRGFIHLNSVNKKEYIQYSPIKRSSGVSKYTLFKQLEFALTAIYLYGNNIFKSIFILFLSTNICFASFKIFLEFTTLSLSITFLVFINLFFSCLLIISLLKVEKKKFVKIQYKILK